MDPMGGYFGEGDENLYSPLIALPGPQARIQDSTTGGGQGPQTSKFPQNHKSSPLCANRDLRFREGAMAPLAPPCIRACWSVSQPYLVVVGGGGGMGMRVREPALPGGGGRWWWYGDEGP